MAKADIWMPLYIGDYLADTGRLTTIQHGAYLLLQMDYWRNGPPPDDPAVLAQITRLSLDAWSMHQAVLKHFFVVEDGVWKHHKIDMVLLEAKENRAKAEQKAKKAAEARWGNASSNAPSMPEALLEECPLTSSLTTSLTSTSTSTPPAPTEPKSNPVPPPLHGAGTEPLDAVPAKKSDKPKTDKPKSKGHVTGTGRTWEAYRAAYLAKYGTEPVRNAKGMANLSMLVERIGIEAAPLVAAWYVSHTNKFYVEKCHSIGLLLADCESLHTQWKTQNPMTANKARHIEQTAGTVDSFGSALERELQAEQAAALAEQGGNDYDR